MLWCWRYPNFLGFRFFLIFMWSLPVRDFNLEVWVLVSSVWMLFDMYVGYGREAAQLEVRVLITLCVIWSSKTHAYWSIFVLVITLLEVRVCFSPMFVYGRGWYLWICIHLGYFGQFVVIKSCHSTYSCPIIVVACDLILGCCLHVFHSYLMGRWGQVRTCWKFGSLRPWLCFKFDLLRKSLLLGY